MGTLYSDKTTAPAKPARANLGTNTVTGTYTVTASLATADVIQMVTIPAGATIQDIIMSCDAGVASTANLSFGDGASTTRFLSSTAHTGATINRIGAAAHGYRYTAEDTIDCVAVSINTPTVGTKIRVTVVYHLDA